MTDALFLGLDVGSSSTKGVLVDADGRTEAVAELPHGISRPRPGWAEHDAERDWWESALDVCRRLVNGRSAAGDRRRGDRSRTVRPAGRRGRATAATRDPLRYRHAGERADRAPDGRARGRRDPGPLRVGALEPVGRAEAPLAGGAGARGVGGHPSRLRRGLLPRLPPHRRVRPRPSHGQPLEPALRRVAERVGRGVGRRRRPGTAVAAPGLAARDVRAGEPRGGRRDGAARRHPRGRRHRRLVGRGGGLWPARARRRSARVRHQHVPRRGPHARAPRPATVGHRRLRARRAERRRGRGVRGSADRVGPRADRRGDVRRAVRGGRRRRSRRRRPPRPALLRRRAHAAVRPRPAGRAAGTDGRPSSRPRPARPARGHGLRRAPEPRDDARGRRDDRAPAQQRRRDVAPALAADRLRRDGARPGRPPRRLRGEPRRCAVRGRRRRRRDARHRVAPAGTRRSSLASSVRDVYDELYAGLPPAGAGDAAPGARPRGMAAPSRMARRRRQGRAGTRAGPAPGREARRRRPPPRCPRRARAWPGPARRTAPRRAGARTNRPRS